MFTVSLVFHVCVILISLLIFFMKFTGGKGVSELFLKTLSKLVPLFTMLYSGVMIFKALGLV